MTKQSRVTTVVRSSQVIAYPAGAGFVIGGRLDDIFFRNESHRMNFDKACTTYYYSSQIEQQSKFHEDFIGRYQNISKQLRCSVCAMLHISPMRLILKIFLCYSETLKRLGLIAFKFFGYIRGGCVFLLLCNRCVVVKCAYLI